MAFTVDPDLIFDNSWQDKIVAPLADPVAARVNQRQLELKLLERAEMA
jgi:hypothetical protein